MAVGVRTLGQQFEFVLYGSVSENNLTALLHRLRGLCDYATEGGSPFQDREFVLKIENASTSVKLQVRQSMDQTEAPWVLSYLGQLELGDASRPTAVRTCVHVGCSHNLMEYLGELGFFPVTEVVLKGHIFRKGPMKILVIKLYQPHEQSGTGLRQFSPNYLVELSAVAASGQDAIGSEMKSFAEHLKPIVVMEKTDGTR